jgi:hypothetical protein
MKALLTLLLMLLTIVATAQRKPFNTVYLKNGSVIKGKLIENKQGEAVKIETADKSIWVFKSDEVDKIVYSENVKTPSDVDYTLKKGLFTQFQAELMPSKKQSAEGTVPAFLGVAGYQINKHFSAGLGTGIEAFHISMMPLFADARYYFLNDRFTPFINLKAGYAFPLENQKDNTRNMNLESKGGWMGGIEIGYVKSLTNTTKFTFSIGYRHQQLIQTGLMDQYYYGYVSPLANYYTSPYKVDRKIVSDFDRIIITLGFRFW